MACEMSGSSAITVPMPSTEKKKNTPLPMPTEPCAAADTRPTTAVSTSPISAWPACASASGQASETTAPISLFQLPSVCEVAPSMRARDV